MTPLDLFVGLQLWVALGLVVIFATYSRAAATTLTAPHLIAMAFFWPAFLIFYGLLRYWLRFLKTDAAAASPNHKLN